MLVGRDDEDAREAAELAGAVGLTQHRRLPRRRDDLVARGEAAASSAWSGSSVEELHERWDGRRRTGCSCSTSASRSEWDAGHIPGSIHTAYHDIHELPDELDAARPVAVICASGQRAAVAASLLQAASARAT